MRLRDRPLLVDGIDRDLYVERPDLESAVERPLRVGRNVLLLGEPGAGKSTLMRWIASRLREIPRPVAWVNATLADDTATFLDLVARGLDGDGPMTGEIVVGPAKGDAPDLLRRARRLRRPEEFTVMVDGLLDPEIGYDVFGRLRDELWETGHSWLVASRRRDSSQLRTPPADAFWNAVVEIPPLDREEVTALLQRGLNPDELDRVEQDRPLAGIFPRALIRGVESSLGGRTGAGLDEAELMRRASRLGSSEEMAMLELLNLGRPASAHDPDLLERLGWSRPYAQRMLSHLEAANLVRSIPERRVDQAGRPRKLYEPLPVHS